MTVKEELSFSTDGVGIYAVEFNLSSEIIAKIKRAQDILLEKDNSFLDSATFSTYLDMKQFDSTLDDDDIKEVEYKNCFYFRYDYVLFSVQATGVYLRVFNKWTSSEYFEVEFNIE